MGREEPAVYLDLDFSSIPKTRTNKNITQELFRLRPHLKNPLIEIKFLLSIFNTFFVPVFFCRTSFYCYRCRVRKQMRSKRIPRILQKVITLSFNQRQRFHQQFDRHLISRWSQIALTTRIRNLMCRRTIYAVTWIGAKFRGTQCSRTCWEKFIHCEWKIIHMLTGI